MSADRYGFFEADADTAAWAATAAEDLGWVFSRLLDGADEGLARPDVELHLPSRNEAAEAVRLNRTLLGRLAVRLPELADDTLALAFPAPFHGVFVYRRSESPIPSRSVWVPWLGESSGFRFVRRMAGDDIRHSWRLGLLGGQFVQGRLDSEKGGNGGVAAPRRTVITAPLVSYPEAIRALLPASAPLIPFLRQGKEQSPWTLIDSLARVWFAADGETRACDEDDLTHRSLVTFPVWLRARLLEAVISVLVEDRVRSGHAVRQALSQPGLGSAGTFQDAWCDLLDHAPVLSRRLVPLDALRRHARVRDVDPLNPVELVSALTEVRRTAAARAVAEQLPAASRQNHPSFRGRICPFQTPESLQVGLTLHLARGADVRPDGSLGATLEDPSGELGFAAGLVPFSHHNDGARNMMGAKNLGQVVPIRGRKAPAILTGAERPLLDLARPLLDVGLCSPTTDPAGDLALGADVLVAYMPWFGKNVDDAIVVSSDLVSNGTFDVELRKAFRRDIRPGWSPAPSQDSSDLNLTVGGLAPTGYGLASGSLIARFVPDGGESRMADEVRYVDRSEAVVEEITFHRRQPHLGGVLRYTLLKRFRLGLGDKLMGRHGNKGVVGAVLAAHEMPRLPVDDRLPAEMRGRAVDLVLNPHGVISRMNLGQLLETHLGWLSHAGVPATDFASSDGAAAPGKAYAWDIDHEAVQRLLVRTGLDRLGRVRLTLPDGTVTGSPVVVGFQHFVRLRHIPELKAQARRGGPRAAYNPVTGQAVHGRLRGGGQRVGEMEVWALAAHQAHRNLDELLGPKSSSGQAGRLPADPSAAPNALTGFAERFRDHLRALLIDLSLATDGSLRFSLLDGGRVRSIIGPNRVVTRAESIESAIKARFSCASRRGPCDYSFLRGAAIDSDAPGSADAAPSLRLRDVLTHLRFREAGVLHQRDGSFVLPLFPTSSEVPAGELLFSVAAKGDQLKATITPGSGAAFPPGWPHELDSLVAYGRYSSGNGSNVDAADVLAEFSTPGGRWAAGSLLISCPVHRTIPLKAAPPFKTVARQIPAGLSDASVFGSLSEAAGSTNPGWGYIDLPTSVPYPISSFVGENATPRGFLERLGIDPDAVPEVSVIPVLPLRYRLPLFRRESFRENEIVSFGYAPILEACARFEKAVSGEERDRIAAEIGQAVAELFSTLVSRLNGKEGLLRRHGMGRRVDRSARLVVTPDPDLEWDEVGLPTSVLLELLGDELHSWITSRGMRTDLVVRLLELLREDRGGPDAAEWSWLRSEKSEEGLQEAYRLLLGFLEDSPRLALLNRQPSLHRDSFQAFRVCPVAPEHGEVIRLSPLSCKGFGADFDGDEMAVHVPVSREAQEEATGLLPSRNLISLASGEPLAHFDQDFVLGLFWLTKSAPGSASTLHRLLPDPCCRASVEANIVDKAIGSRLLRHLAVAHPEGAVRATHQLALAAFDRATRVGASFGFYDLLEICHGATSAFGDGAAPVTTNDFSSLNPSLQRAAIEILEQVLYGAYDEDSPGLHLAAMAVSGARGRSQVRQLFLSRGFLDPGSLAFPISPVRSIVRSSLAGGMTDEEAFAGSLNARSSMCDKKLGTRAAGYLTRKLVLALWAWRITADRCSVAPEDARVLSCQQVDGFCSRCYGLLSSGEPAPRGLPVGLIAAQSIGERGTQLSMQSFHTGEKSIRLQDVLAVLSDADYFETRDDGARFLSFFWGTPAYRNVLPRHIELLWRVIHESPQRTLRSAIAARGSLTRITFEQQAKGLLLAALTRSIATADDPAFRILTGTFATAVGSSLDGARS